MRAVDLECLDLYGEGITYCSVAQSHRGFGEGIGALASRRAVLLADPAKIIRDRHGEFHGTLPAEMPMV